MPRDLGKVAAGCAALLAVCALAQAFLPAISQSGESGAIHQVYSAGPLRINELMSRNSGTIVDDGGATADWFEVMNVGNSAVDLGGYMVAKDEGASNVFTFPSMTLEPGACVLVFADSTLRSAADEELHAPFKLSSAGGTLMLFSPSGTAIDTVNFPSLSADTSYARQGLSEWSVSDHPTPGLPNDEANYQALHQVVSGAGVELSEIVASNTRYAPDENGAYQDYIELYNAGTEAVDVSGWFLSDTPGLPLKWRLPEGMVLQPGECCIVYASGRDRADPAHPHANFNLSTEGETVTLADDRGRLVDETAYDLLGDDEAWLRGADGAWTRGTPSPGTANG